MQAWESVKLATVIKIVRNTMKNVVNHGLDDDDPFIESDEYKEIQGASKYLNGNDDLPVWTNLDSDTL